MSDHSSKCPIYCNKHCLMEYISSICLKCNGHLCDMNISSQENTLISSRFYHDECYLLNFLKYDRELSVEYFRLRNYSRYYHLLYFFQYYTSLFRNKTLNIIDDEIISSIYTDENEIIQPRYHYLTSSYIQFNDTKLYTINIKDKNNCTNVYCSIGCFVNKKNSEYSTDNDKLEPFNYLDLFEDDYTKDNYLITAENYENDIKQGNTFGDVSLR